MCQRRCRRFPELQGTGKSGADEAQHHLAACQEEPVARQSTADSLELLLDVVHRYSSCFHSMNIHVICRSISDAHDFAILRVHQRNPKWSRC